MLNEQDEKDIKFAGKATGKMKANSEASGFVKIPKDGMKEVREKLKSFKGKKVKGTIIKFQQISNAMLVFELIVEYAFNGDGHGGFENCMWWSAKTMAEELGASDKVVRNAINLLREAGVILTLYRYNNRERQSQYFYFPVFGNIEELGIEQEISEKPKKKVEVEESAEEKEEESPKRNKIIVFPFKPNRKVPKPKRIYTPEEETIDGYFSSEVVI